MTVLGNNIPFPAGTPSINLPTCGLLGATICAPPGMGPYSWAGPGVVAPYTSLLQSNQCYSTGINADFTLTMNPPGSCNPINRIITVTITPAPYLIPSVVQAACGVNTAVVSYTAAGSASVNPVISFSSGSNFYCPKRCKHWYCGFSCGNRCGNCYPRLIHWVVKLRVLLT